MYLSIGSSRITLSPKYFIYNKSYRTNHKKDHLSSQLVQLELGSFKSSLVRAWIKIELSPNDRARTRFIYYTSLFKRSKPPHTHEVFISEQPFITNSSLTGLLTSRAGPITRQPWAAREQLDSFAALTLSIIQFILLINNAQFPQIWFPFFFIIKVLPVFVYLISDLYQGCK